MYACMRAYLLVPVDRDAWTDYTQRHVDGECGIAIGAAPTPERFGDVCLSLAHSTGSSTAMQVDCIAGGQAEVQGSAQQRACRQGLEVVEHAAEACSEKRAVGASASGRERREGGCEGGSRASARERASSLESESWRGKQGEHERRLTNPSSTWLERRCLSSAQCIITANQTVVPTVKAPKQLIGAAGGGGGSRLCCGQRSKGESESAGP